MKREPLVGELCRIFAGKDGKHNKEIVEKLALEGGRDRHSLSKELSMPYSTIHRRLRDLEGYMKIKGYKKTKTGKDTPVYCLNLRGSLAALLLISVQDHLRMPKFLDNAYQTNRFFKALKLMLDKDVDVKIVGKLLEDLKEAVRKRTLSIEADVEILGEVLSYVFLDSFNSIKKGVKEGDMIESAQVEKAEEVFRSVLKPADSAKLSPSLIDLLPPEYVAEE